MSEEKEPAKVANPAEYKPNDQAAAKIVELTTKRQQYVDAIEKVDMAILQLRYGISQRGIEGASVKCNGFGIGFDASDFACRELCDRTLHLACKSIVTEELKKRASDKINPDMRYFGLTREQMERSINV